ncbi:unnamed protein product [Oppiella nova]|uniref:Membrane insertase YidC/Oxa/ALB C-terminal domain-containing protein n=1 Tax=Oppiella nova TaxID=334625 RepID=A0A7R9MEK7_9ACAR|nr:unnamed protein product [Oppiella nova]CAG2175939.1 unnamed protein product [Oppiella nova]
MYRNVCQVLCNTCKSNGLLVRRPLTTNAYNYGLFSVISQKIANSLVVNSAKDQLILWHEWTGMSWSAEIAVVTIAIRALITFPLTVGQHKILAKYDALRPELIQFGQRLKKEVDSAQYLYNWSPIKAKLMYNLRMKQETKRLIIRDNCHPMKGSIVVWVQIPVWVILSHAIRNMSFMYPIADHNSQLIHSQLSTEGILWFSNLTLSDPYLVLPFLTAVVNLTIVQVIVSQLMDKLFASLFVSPKRRQ